MKIIIFGPQGSGKGTQAKLLSEKLNIPHISTGKIFRDNIEEQTDLGKEAQKYMAQGNLVPDDLVIALIKDRLAETDCSDGFILDGYPRTMPQAESLDAIIKLDLALEIWIPDEEAIHRISQRRSCSVCGEIFHLSHKPPKVESVCDKCGGKLIVRDDDQEKAIKQRLASYHKLTEPLIDHYKAQDIYMKIDGRPAIEAVKESIFEIFKQLKLID
ncbi:MAG: adenylate kinase [Candidatus Komeilibacteria bacterium CG10_big_fil_rev_8_21_14_0_10_41_13]|uniref:Adenylate kinase n=1 Tax=Candidatus Komeilibacteria bacterium CG10_big_fil_rev_8_21_14_0_10_41_13 TaxID=1974476 RepID=A0A2M6WCB5_9BACT|nr:MAG: adenylate kinase [Candidatus Komeilibacteria bacterium CG10_big_fil_rev_8_21_14_0_10_41_13]